MRTGLVAVAPPAVGKVAATPAAGVPLVNGTPSILTVPVPNDGNKHYYSLAGALGVTSTETGGAVALVYTVNGVGQVVTVLAANQAGPATYPITSTPIIADPGTNVVVGQSTALTAGAATLFAEITGQ
jgi:hypothetical protein